MKLSLLRAHTLNGSCPGGWFLGNYSLGLEHTVVQVGGKPYLGRWIVYVAGFTLRLHRFFKGDDMRAPHDHPWSFWTFPLCREYRELMVDHLSGALVPNTVRGWRWNYRPSSYQHIVADPPSPFYTIVVTGRKDRGWGFWPECSMTEAVRPNMVFWASLRVFRKFVPWREWK